MYLVGGLYHFLYQHGGYRFINFGIIRLGFLALDKTIIYFIIYLIFRILFNLFLRKKRISFKREILFDLFVFYLVFVLFFTIFRKQYWPWQIQFDFRRPINEVNWIPFVQTLKMKNGITKTALIYNCLGNIILFVPFGIFLCAIKKKIYARKIITFFEGFIFSILIETAQFLIHSGQADIDDVIFNTIGLICGIGIYHFIFEKKVRKHHRKWS